MANERHTRREFLGIAGARMAGVATGASLTKNGLKNRRIFGCTIAAEQGSFAPK